MTQEIAFFITLARNIFKEPPSALAPTRLGSPSRPSRNHLPSCRDHLCRLVTIDTSPRIISHEPSFLMLRALVPTDTNRPWPSRRRPTRPPGIKKAIAPTLTMMVGDGAMACLWRAVAWMQRVMVWMSATVA